MRKAILFLFLPFLSLFPFKVGLLAEGIDSGLELVSVSLPGRADRIFVQGDYAYVGAGSFLQIYDITDPRHPELVGETVVGRIYDIYLEGDRAYIAAGFNGVRIVDVSDPTEPAVIGYYKTTNRACYIEKSGNLLYVANIFRGLEVVDASDPGDIKRVGLYELSGMPGELSIIRMRVRDGLLYLLAAPSKLLILDCSDPSHLSEVGSFDIEQIGGGQEIDHYHYSDIQISDSLAYLVGHRFTPETNLQAMLWILDMSDPSRPRELTSHIYSEYDLFRGIFISDRTLYTIAGPDCNVVAIDVADPSLPNLMWQYAKGSQDLYVQDRHIYLAASRFGLRVMDISDWSSPEVVAQCHTGDEVHAVKVIGDYVYVANGYDGFRILDVSDPGTPRVGGGLPAAPEGSFDIGARITDVDISGDLACLLDQKGRLQTVDVSDSTAPRVIGYYDIRNVIHADNVVISGDIAYVSIGSGAGGSLKAIDISDPTTPSEIWSYPLTLDPGSISISDGLAFVAGKCKGVEVIDLHDPANPRKAPFIEVQSESGQAFISEPYLYLNAKDGLHILDISEPSQPKEVGQLTLHGGGQTGLEMGIFVSGERVYLSRLESPSRGQVPKSSSWVVYLIDISDPANLVVVSRYNQLPGFDLNRISNENNIWVSNGYLYVANYCGGLYILNSGPFTAVEQSEEGLQSPSEAFLGQNYPNPFNAGTVISFQIAKDSKVSLQVYNLLGQEVTTLVNGHLKAGMYRVRWDGKDGAGNPAASGVYLYRLTTEGGMRSGTKRMLLLR